MEVITKQIKDQSGVEQVVYEAKLDGQGSVSLFALAFKNQAPALSEEQAEKLFMGETVETRLSYKDVHGNPGEASPCSIVPVRTEERSKQVGEEVFDNRVLKVGVAWHLLKKEDNSIYGYKIFNKRANGGNGSPVKFFKNAFVGEDERVELTPKDCFDLIEKGRVEIAGKTICYEGEIRKDKSGELLKIQNARLRVSEPGA